jgi:hypothetical protein
MDLSDYTDFPYKVTNQIADKGNVYGRSIQAEWLGSALSTRPIREDVSHLWRETGKVSETLYSLEYRKNDPKPQ